MNFKPRSFAPHQSHQMTEWESTILESECVK